MIEDKTGYNLNLASKPFVNMTVPITLATLFALLIIAFTVFNLWVIFSDTIKGTDSEALIANVEERIDLLKQDIDKEDEKLSAFNIPRVSREVLAANEIIRQRSMSWTRLFDRLEIISPGDLRMLQISPNASRTHTSLNLRVEVPKQEVLRTFIKALEESAYFSDISVSSEALTKKSTQIWELSMIYYDAQ